MSVLIICIRCLFTYIKLNKYKSTSTFRSHLSLRWPDKEEMWGFTVSRGPTDLESWCSYSSPAAELQSPAPLPPPRGGNKADSALQLLRWPEWDTGCSWPDRVPDTPDRSCRSRHKCGWNPDDGREKVKRPHPQTPIDCNNFPLQSLLLCFERSTMIISKELNIKTRCSRIHQPVAGSWLTAWTKGFIWNCATVIWEFSWCTNINTPKLNYTTPGAKTSLVISWGSEDRVRIKMIIIKKSTLMKLKAKMKLRLPPLQDTGPRCTPAHSCRLRAGIQGSRSHRTGDLFLQTRNDLFIATNPIKISTPTRKRGRAFWAATV